MSLFNIGVSGLQAQQAALNVVGQNITNAGTPGYTRQRADLEAVVGSAAGRASGAGVRVQDVSRIAGAFVAEQIRSDVSLFSELDSFSTRISQLESGLFDGQFGLDAAMRDFFDAMQNAANEPADLSMRAFVLDSAEALVNRFHGLDERASSQAKDVNASLESSTQRVNELSNVLVQVNDRIAGLSGGQGTSALNAMLDKRDELVKELSQYLNVQTTEQTDGQISIFVGKGQPLVLGQTAAQLSVTTGGEIALQPAGSSIQQIVTKSLSGGEIGGLLKYREEVLTPAQVQIGQIAAAFSVAFNQQHSLGVDLEGQFGGEFFRNLNDPALVGSRVGFLENSNGPRSNGQINVYIDDPLAADATNYEIFFSEESPGAYDVRRSDTGEIVHRGASLTIPQEISFEGIRVEFASGEMVPGSQVLVTPYLNSAADIEVALTDPGSVALASPVIAEADPANSGSATLTIEEIFDPDHPLLQGDQALLPPLLIEFVSESQYRVLDNTDPSRPVPLEPDLGLMSIASGAVAHLLPHELGSTVLTSAGTQVGQLVTGAGFVSSLTPSANGYPSGSITVNSSEAGVGSQVVNFAPNQSAREMAAQINGNFGVSASARTEITLTDFVNYGSGTAVEIAINGELMTGFSDLADLADQINANNALQIARIRAVSDGQSLSLVAENGDDLALHFQGDPNESVVVTNSTGQQTSLNGSLPGSYSTVTVGGEIVVHADPGVTIAADHTGMFGALPGQVRSDLGFDVVLNGNVNAGDRFNLSFNQGGVGDNRNALSLAELGERELMGDPPRSFFGTYASLVQDVGIQAAQVDINKEAAAALLAQSEAFRESISGVNLDEEAALLIRHEQAYNAAAQIISVARDVFNVLLNSVS